MTQPDIPSADGENVLIPQALGSELELEDRNKIILVAEDNLVNQKIAILLLEKLGLQAQVVNNGLEAVEAVKVNIYPVVLMDCHMPEMDGFEATRQIRRFEANLQRHTPIIAVTALAMVGDRERCIEAGMDDYIAKPIDRERLKSKLNQWMKKEFVFHNQKLAERYFEANPAVDGYQRDPIDLAELEVFYGSNEEVADVLTLFINTTRQIIGDLQTAVSDHRTNSAARMAHELKGSSASVGAKEMALLCLQLEQEIGQQQWTAGERTLVSLTTCFNRIEEFVMSVFAKNSGKLQS